MHSSNVVEQYRYHGWLLEFVIEPTGYSFHCWLPGKTIGVSDRHTYGTLSEAIVAAHNRVDLEVARLAVQKFLDLARGRGRLKLEEYAKLSDSVSNFVAASDSRLSVLTELPPQPGLAQQEPIICYYKNQGSFIQVARIINVKDWYFERTIFPGDRLLFKSFPDAVLEIYVSMNCGIVLLEKMRCTDLQVSE